MAKWWENINWTSDIFHFWNQLRLVYYHFFYLISLATWLIGDIYCSIQNVILLIPNAILDLLPIGRRRILRTISQLYLWLTTEKILHRVSQRDTSMFHLWWWSYFRLSAPTCTGTMARWLLALWFSEVVNDHPKCTKYLPQQNKDTFKNSLNSYSTSMSIYYYTKLKFIDFTTSAFGTHFSLVYIPRSLLFLKS